MGLGDSHTRLGVFGEWSGVILKKAKYKEIVNVGFVITELWFRYRNVR